MYTVIQLFLRQAGSVAQNQAACIGDLVVEEFAEILLIHLALLGIYHSGKAVQFHIMGMDILHSTNDIAELSDTGRLNDNPIRVILFQYLEQCLSEIAYQTTANAAGVHLCDFHTGILQKAAVNADLAKFIFN